jgi:uncharacterized protein
MQFENTFDVPLPPEDAWKVLLDVPRIAPCLPGAELTETIGPDTYKGRAGVKVGPVHLYFAGEAQILNKNDVDHTADVKAKGNDTKGRGQASANVNFALRPEGTGTRVVVKTDLNMTGAVAQYGRASGLMKEIAGAILKQFADNLRAEIERAQPAAAATAPDATETAPAAPSTSLAAPAQSRNAAAAAGAPAPAAVPISAFSILWIAVKSWLAGLLGLKRG